MNRESRLMRQIQLKASQLGARLFRNNVGVGWLGNPCGFCQHTLRRVRYGLQVGSSDQIGWQTITITPEMVGRNIAVFLAVEVKDGSRTTKEQVAFLKAVINAGGRGLVAQSLEDFTL